MPLGILTKQPSFSGIVTGSAGTASTKITPKGRHYATYLLAKKAGGTAMTEAEITAAIGSIEVRLNGGIVSSARPQTLRNIYFRETGEVLDNGIIPLIWYNTALESFEERVATGIGCANVQDFMINAILLAGGVLVTLETWSDYNPTINEDIGTYRQIFELPRTFGSTGDFEDNTIPTYGDDCAFKALHIIPGTNGVLQDLTFKTDDFERVSRATPAILKAESEMVGLHEISGWASLHFDLGRKIGSVVAMAGVKTPRLTTNWSVANTTAFYVVIDAIRGVLNTAQK